MIIMVLVGNIENGNQLGVKNSLKTPTIPRNEFKEKVGICLDIPEKDGNKNNVLVGNSHLFGVKKVYFDPIFSIIGEDKAEIVLNFKDKYDDKNKHRFKLYLDYNIFHQQESCGQSETKGVFIKSIKIDYTEKKIKNGWKLSYIDYSKILPIICDILNNYRFNPYIQISN